jgi:hypothetical protein
VSRYNRLDDLIPIIFIATSGGQANYSVGNTTSTPFFFRRITMNFAGSVVLALRPTVCTSLGPTIPEPGRGSASFSARSSAGMARLVEGPI